MRKLPLIPLLTAVLLLPVLLLQSVDAGACTSLIADGRATASGRPMLWKHRDTGAPSNFLARVEPRCADEIGFVGLFNAGDSLLAEAWAGMNDAGFAIMNTASYNLAPDTTDYCDREAIVMSRALAVCHTVADFAALLDTLPKPLGVQANFGVIDAEGNAAYFETHDHDYTRFNTADEPSGMIIRTNFSISGKQDGSGSGYNRYDTAHELLDSIAAQGRLTPAFLTDTVSRSFRHALMGRDPLADGDLTIADGEFIPRRISTASIVVEGILPRENPLETMSMRAAPGYPPLAEVFDVSLTSIPAAAGPDMPGWDSSAARKANELRDKVFHFRGSDREKYIDLEILRELMEK
ncbi:MAG: hypothetical protein K2M06_03030 [Muribaculaceae bacterium]|nr:hypothetical protein [Muribaculaceae bacterium]